MSFWKKVKSKSRFLFIVCLILCLVSGFGAAAVSGNFGGVHIERITWVNSLGNTVSGLLYVPNTATAEAPAPAVVTVHGWYNTNEFQDLFNTELARRGYVVLSPDMQGHGYSEILDWNHLYEDASGINGAVELLATQNYVDTARIGLTGHSSGGDQAGAALAIDNERETPLIAAVLWQASIWVDDEGVDHLDDIGARQAGVLAPQYDEFFYGAVPRDFIRSDDAKAFLSFNGAEALEAEPVVGQYYSSLVDGEEVSRIIYNPPITHPRAHFNRQCVSDLLEFFDTALGAPNAISVTSQVWPVMTFFKGMGLVAWIFAFLTFALAMLDTQFFSALRAENGYVAPLPRHQGKKGKAWFWVPLVLCGLLNAVLFVAIQHAIVVKPTIVSFWPQTSSLGVGTWAAVTGVIALLVFVLYYKLYGKKHGYDVRARGSIIPKGKLWKSVLLACLTLMVGFGILYTVNYFFNMDFRFYLVAAHTMNPETLLIALRFLPFFLVSHIINSLVINGPFYNDIGAKRWKHGNLAIVIFFNVLGMLILWLIQYVNFYITGERLFNGSLGILICFIWMIPVIFNIVATSILSRTIYKKSGNPYIGGIINGVLVTLVQCASTTTVFMSAASESYLPM